MNGADFDELLLNILETRAGDGNLDGKVNSADFLGLSATFGEAGGWSDGDYNGDGHVDFADFLLLSSNFGFGPT